MEKVKISKVCKISNGYAFKSNKYTSEEGARVIRITNVQKGKIVDNDPKIYPNSELSKLENYKIFENDILMSLTGNVGRVGKFPQELLPAYINQRVCRIMPKSEELDIDYLFHFLNSDKFEKDAIQNSAGAAQLNLSTNWLAEYKIPLPPLETQKYIAQILDDAAALRNKTEQLIKEYDALAQSVFLDMFGDTKLNPLNWEIATLSEICTEIIDCPHSTPNYVDYETEFPCIRTTELQNGNISWKRMKYLDEVGYKLRIKRLKPQEGDIIYGREGTIGEAALIPKNIKLSLGQRVMLFRANYKLVNNVFLLNVIRSKGLLHQALRKNTGSTVSHVNVKDIKNFKIILPDLELQKQFAEKITLIEQQKELAKQELKESEDLFNCLLQKAFKGELM